MEMLERLADHWSRATNAIPFRTMGLGVRFSCYANTFVSVQKKDRWILVSLLCGFVVLHTSRKCNAAFTLMDYKFMGTSLTINFYDISCHHAIALYSKKKRCTWRKKDAILWVCFKMHLTKHIVQFLFYFSFLESQWCASRTRWIDKTRLFSIPFYWERCIPTALPHARTVRVVWNE
jgi:hypothetical protein